MNVNVTRVLIAAVRSGNTVTLFTVVVLINEDVTQSVVYSAPSLFVSLALYIAYSCNTTFLNLQYAVQKLVYVHEVDSPFPLFEKM